MENLIPFITFWIMLLMTTVGLLHYVYCFPWGNGPQHFYGLFRCTVLTSGGAHQEAQQGQSNSMYNVPQWPVTMGRSQLSTSNVPYPYLKDQSHFLSIWLYSSHFPQLSASGMVFRTPLFIRLIVSSQISFNFTFSVKQKCFNREYLHKIWWLWTLLACLVRAVRRLTCRHEGVHVECRCSACSSLISERNLAVRKSLIHCHLYRTLAWMFQLNS